MTEPLERRLDRAEAAQFLTERGFKTKKSVLQKLACTGGGPPYEIYGSRSLYTPTTLLEWALAKLKPPRTSTSEAAARVATKTGATA